LNEPRSHGFVSFRIHPRLPLLPGDAIENIANIHFDFNPPVITEPSVLVADFSTSVQERPTHSIEVYPDPAEDLLNVILGPGSDRACSLHSTDGRVVRVLGRSCARGLQLDVSGLAPGIYLLRTAQGVARFMKR